MKLRRGAVLTLDVVTTVGLAIECPKLFAQELEFMWLTYSIAFQKIMSRQCPDAK
jgi:hypothetical protein